MVQIQCPTHSNSELMSFYVFLFLQAAQEDVGDGEESRPETAPADGATADEDPEEDGDE